MDISNTLCMILNYSGNYQALVLCWDLLLDVMYHLVILNIFDTYILDLC